MSNPDREVLIANKWEPMVGYCFPTPKAEESDMLTFVEKDMAEKVMSEGVKEFFWNEGHDNLFTLDEAWDYFLDDWMDEHDKEYPETKDSDNSSYVNVEDKTR